VIATQEIEAGLSLLGSIAPNLFPIVLNTFSIAEIHH
jgi:hypothetical protein